MRRLDLHQIDEAVRLLAQDQVVAIPTDTVYGLAARLESPKAVAALFAAKDRPPQVALPVLVADLAAATSLLGELPEPARRAAELLWPGALTLVLSCDPELASRVGSATPTIGLRIPHDELTLELLRGSGPLAVTSANLHGRPECTSADAVIAQLDAGPVAAVLDAGRRSGRPSTVAALSGDRIEILRPGAVSLEQLEAAISEG